MIKICKISILFSFIAFTLVLPYSVNAQPPVLNQHYSFNFHNNSIGEILDSIRLKTSYGVTYNPEMLPAQQMYSGIFRQVTIIQILDTIIPAFGLHYQIIGTTIAILQNTDKNDEPKPITFSEKDTITVIRISGKLEDYNNNEALPFASIYIQNKAYGTISNIDGNFTFTLPYKYLNDSLSFSYIGFHTVSRKIDELMPEGNIIRMKPHTVQLKEVVIKNYKAPELIQKSIEKIPENYSNNPLMLTSFYRETLQQNGHYVVLSEAILKIYKSAYTNSQTDQVTIYKGRKLPMAKTMDTILFKLQGGIYNSIMIDIAKYHSNFMSGENFELYEYTFGEMTTIQDHLVFVVEFDQKDGINYALFKGKIYIDYESLAIVRAEFSLSPKGIKYAAESMVRKSPPRVKVRPVEANYLVNYTNRNKTWHLGNIREELIIKVRKRYNLFNITFHSVVEMAVTHSDSTNVKRFRNNEIVRSNDIFTEKLTRYDPDFWENFNYIPPDISIEEAIAEIREKLEKK